MVLYSICDEQSWLDVDDWVKGLRETQPLVPVIIVGNQLDKHYTDPNNRKIDTKTASNYAIQNGFLFSETSAVYTTNVEETFQTLAEKMYSYRNPKKLNKRVSWRDSKGRNSLEDKAEWD